LLFKPQEVLVTLPFDYDLTGLFWTTAIVLFTSKPQLRKNSRPIPARFDRQIVEESSLSEQQKKYFAPFDAQLAALNYRPMCTFRVANYGTNMLREYSNPADAAHCTLTVVEVQTTVKGLKTARNSGMVSFTTRFSGGKELATRNMEMKSLMDSPEYRVVQDCPNVTNLAELKKRHDARAADFGIPVSPPRDVPSLFEAYEVENQRHFAHQVARGLLQLNPQGDAYLVTDKVFNRGIRNFFNPFARRLTLKNALLSLLVSAVIPLYGILKLAPAIAERVGSDPAVGLGPVALTIAACYAVTGVILGLFSEVQSYVWVVLITYIPAHLIAGSSLGRFPYSTLAFFISYFVCRAKQKRQLVLQS
jgi:hypothetical protein